MEWFAGWINLRHFKSPLKNLNDGQVKFERRPKYDLYLIARRNFHQNSPSEPNTLTKNGYVIGLAKRVYVNDYRSWNVNYLFFIFVMLD